MKLREIMDMMRRCGLLIEFLFCIEHVAWLGAAGVHNWSSMFSNNPSNNWVVLAAGSHTWRNYRHQADVYHAYHVMRKNNVPAENIITFAYDDIAKDRSNPFKGKVFHDYELEDVYKGVIIDYRGRDVTSKNFINVLKGDKKLEANKKKVLKSGPDDNVFIFFSGHGAVSSITFPDARIRATELNDTLAFMHSNKMYNKLVLYVEACYSGSMFLDVLPSNLGIYVTTSANEKEESLSAFCHDKRIKVCLANQYSYAWITDSEYNDLKKRTLEQQYKEVDRRTEYSHVMQYGDMTMGILPVGKFQGHYDLPTNQKDAGIAVRVQDNAREIFYSLPIISCRKPSRFFQLGHIVKETFRDIIMDMKTHHKPKLMGLSKKNELIMTTVLNTDASLPYNHDLFESLIIKKRMKGWPPLYLRHSELGMVNSTLFGKKWFGICNTCPNQRSFWPRRQGNVPRHRDGCDNQHKPTIRGFSKRDEPMCFKADPKVVQHTTHLMELCKAGYEAETVVDYVHIICS
ncbi:hypothetical protein T265_10753 [Opisthorchis viverrini]|uniref:Hemoglobinase n=1 Tax=Opisthorchis viverrini TaxID=6198 RepID=A0A074Z148_OPIVI|nr:hypothetical protein T265_10753 [Opisthorchis viverrini]KER20766.1 hypothetical protein T265_10753 [Opisthorchis viverrini]